MKNVCVFADKRDSQIADNAAIVPKSIRNLTFWILSRNASTPQLHGDDKWVQFLGPAS
jgi:hypothetical protein